MESKELLKHIKYMQKIVKGNHVLPICDCVMLKGGKLYASNLETVIILDIGIKGEFVTDLKQLVKIIPSLKGDVKFTLKGDKVLATDGKRNYKLKSHPICDFPKIPKTGKKVYTFNAMDIENIVKCKDFVCDDELRPSMQGIFMDKKNFCATDAHKLFYPKLSKPFKDEPFIIDNIVCKLLKGIESCDVLRTETHNTFKYGNCKIITRNIDGKYPNWKAVIPNKANATSIINKEIILNTIKAALPCVNKETYRITFFSEKKKAMRVQTIDLDFENEFEESIPSKNKGELKFSVNAKFLELAVKTLEDENVSFNFTAHNRALILNNKTLLMPLKFDE